MKETNDCIYRKAALDCIREYIEEYSEVDSDGLHNLKWCAMKEAETVLTDLPAADVRPVAHGKWGNLFRCGFSSVEAECNACGKKMMYKSWWNFCPNCGADMREVTDEKQDFNS